MKEQWKDIVGYEGLYEVSNLGRIKSKRITNDSSIFNCRILKGYLSPSGYIFVTLYRNSIKKNKKPHRLVGEHFLDNPENKPCINHIDGIKINNEVSNLEWCTFSENTLHAYRIGLMSRKAEKNNMYGIFGSDNHSSIPVIQLDFNNNIIKHHECIRAAERDTGVSNQNISKVCKGKRPTAGGFIWKYYNM